MAKPGSTAKRLVVDYGELNKKTLNHSGSIPNVESTLEKIASCRYKTKMDKRSGFWQVDLTPNAQELLALITPQGRLFNHFLSVYFFSIDPQHFVDGSTSSPGFSVIGENPGLSKFWSLSRSFQIITSIPESRSTLATFQLTPSRLFVHPENIMNFTLFGSSKAADDGLSTLFNYSPSHLFHKHQASNSPLQTRFPLKAKYLTHANAFSFPKFTAAYKTTPSFTWMWKAPIFNPPLLGATPRKF